MPKFTFRPALHIGGQHLVLHVLRQPEQRHHLGDPRPRQPLPPRQRRPALHLAAIEQRLVLQSPLELRPPAGPPSPMARFRRVARFALARFRAAARATTGRPTPTPRTTTRPPPGGARASTVSTWDAAVNHPGRQHRTFSGLARIGSPERIVDRTWETTCSARPR